MNRTIRLAEINRLRKLYMPNLGEITETDEENIIVRGLVSEWEDRERSDLLQSEVRSNPEYEAALAEYEEACVRLVRPVSPKTAFDTAIAVMSSRGWSPRPPDTGQENLDIFNRQYLHGIL